MQGVAAIAVEQMESAQRQGDLDVTVDGGFDRSIGHGDHQLSAGLDAEMGLIAEPLIIDWR